MPIYNWLQIHRTGNLTYLRKTLDESRIETNDKLTKRWETLYNEFIDRYGFGEEFKQLMRLKKLWLSQLCDYVINEDRTILMEAEFTSTEIEQIMLDSAGVSQDDAVIMMEQNLGFKLDIRTISVVEYYNYVEYFTKMSKNNG